MRQPDASDKPPARSVSGFAVRLDAPVRTPPVRRSLERAGPKARALATRSRFLAGVAAVPDRQAAADQKGPEVATLALALGEAATVPVGPVRAAMHRAPLREADEFVPGDDPATVIRSIGRRQFCAISGASSPSSLIVRSENANVSPPTTRAGPVRLSPLFFSQASPPASPTRSASTMRRSRDFMCFSRPGATDEGPSSGAG
jgi:hypothetical protein